MSENVFFILDNQYARWRWILMIKQFISFFFYYLESIKNLYQHEINGTFSKWLIQILKIFEDPENGGR